MGKLFTEATAQLMLAEMRAQNNYLSQLTCAGTKALSESSGAGLHNSIFRGKNLGSALTAAQSAAIRAGTFDDLFIGDFWAMEVTYTYKDANEVDQTVTATVIFRIADFDYYLKSGDQGSGLATHHIVVVPDTVLYTARMNETNTTEGGYVGSEMYTKNLARAKALITAAFGSGHILTHREYLQNAVTDGRPSGGAWLNSTVELMTEQMVYGGKVFGIASNGEVIPNLYIVSKSQLNLFRLRPDLIIASSGSSRSWWWLRDVVSGLCFASVGNSGGAVSASASNSGGGVRPDSLPCNFGHSSYARSKGRKDCPLCRKTHKCQPLRGWLRPMPLLSGLVT